MLVAGSAQRLCQARPDRNAAALLAARHDQIADIHLHRLIVLIQRRRSDLDETLVRARLRWARLEHFDLEVQLIPRSHGLGQRNSSNPAPMMPPAGLNSLSTNSRIISAAVCQP